MEKKPPTVGAILFEHHQEYEKKLGRRISQQEFAEYIGLKKSMYSHIVNGKRKPSNELLEHLVKFFDDLRFYDALGIPRPVEDLIYLQTSWGRLPKTLRDEMHEKAKLYITNLEEKGE